MVVQKARHAVRIAVNAHHLPNTFTQFLRGMTSCHHIAHAAVQGKIEHALQDRLALCIAHIAFNFGHGLRLARLVDGKTFTEAEEIFAPSLLRHDAHAGLLGVFCIQEILHGIRRHKESGV